MSNSQIKRTHATRLQPRARKNQVAAVTPVWQEGQPIRILLAEDHTIVRKGIRSLLDRSPEFRVVAEAADGQEALRLAELHRPDLVIMDLGMPVMNGVAATERMVRQIPSIRVIILSMYWDYEYVAQALQAGAAGYVVKKSAAAGLDQAVRAVLRGERYLCSSLGPDVLGRLAEPSRPAGGLLDKLTPRQREILQLIAERRTTKEIAFLLELSTKTVEYHRVQLMKRVKVSSLSGLVSYALGHGISSLEP